MKTLVGRTAIPPVLCAVLAVLGTGAHPAQAGWQAVPSGTTADLHEIIQVGNDGLLVAGDGGTILRSSDDGATWAPLASGTSAGLVSVDAHTSITFWAGGEGGTVVVSTNGGTTWVDRSAPTTATVHLFSRSGGVSWAVGDDGGILKTTNSGVDWLPQPSGTTSALHDGEGFSSGPAHIVGDDGTILRSSNGVEWAPINSGTSANLYGYVEPSYRIAVGASGTVLKSTDAGLTWSPRNSGVTVDLYDVDVNGANGSKLTAVGAYGMAIKTTNSGQTWCLIPTGTTATLNAVRAMGNNRFVAVGEGGLIFVTDDAGGTCLDPAEVADDLDMDENGVRGNDVDEPRVDETDGGPRVARGWLTLSDITPNPARSQTSVTMHLAGSGSEIRWRLLDPGGREVRSRQVGWTPSGTRSLPIDLSGLPGGVYLAIVEGAGISGRAKLVVMR